jgi:F-type H+-transporting ATPase subunit b
MGDLLIQLGINFKVVLINAVVFVILFAILAKFLFSRVGGFIQKREGEIEDSMKQIEEKQKEVDRMAAEYGQRMAEIEKEAQAKLQEAVKEGVRIRDEIRAKAEKDRIHELDKVKAEIAAERDKAIGDLRKDAGKMAVEIAERILAEQVPPNVHERIVGDYLKDLGGSR